jgi:hypothetical protein
MATNNSTKKAKKELSPIQKLSRILRKIERIEKHATDGDDRIEKRVAEYRAKLVEKYKTDPETLKALRSDANDLLKQLKLK